MKIKCLQFFIILTGAALFAQAPAIEWQKALGGSASESTGGADSVIQTSDGGYMVTGSTMSTDGDISENHGSYDIWMVKLSTSGAIEWEKSLGGTGYEHARSVIQTSDGGYMIAGVTMSADGDISENHGSADYWLVKLTSSGEIEWEKTYGGPGSETASSIIEMNDGGYMVCGWSDSQEGDVEGNHGGRDGWVLKLDASGEIQWQKPLGGSNEDVLYSIRQTNDGGFITAGYSDSNDGDLTHHYGTPGDFISDAWVVKLNSEGEIDWQKSMGGAGYDHASDVVQTPDGNYVAVADTDSTDGDVEANNGLIDVWVVGFNNSGEITWQNSLGGSSGDVPYSINTLSGNGYIITGHTESNDGDVSGNHGGADYWAVRLDATGELAWQKCLGGSAADFGSSVDLTSDGGYILAGHTASDDGDVTGFHGTLDYWVVKLEPDNMAVADFSKSKINIFPNPVKDQLNFSETLQNIEIYTLSGQKVIWENGNLKSINIGLLLPGTYLIKAETIEGESVTKKIIKK